MHVDNNIIYRESLIYVEMEERNATEQIVGLDAQVNQRTQQNDQFDRVKLLHTKQSDGVMKMRMKDVTNLINPT